MTKRIIEAAGGPVLAVIDLVNGTQTARFAFDALRKGGKLIQVGLFGGELIAAAAADGDPGADRAGQLCRQP